MAEARIIVRCTPREWRRALFISDAAAVNREQRIVYFEETRSRHEWIDTFLWPVA